MRSHSTKGGTKFSSWGWEKRVEQKFLKIYGDKGSRESFLHVRFRSKFHQALNLVTIQTSALMLRNVSHSWRSKSMFLISFIFLGLILIHTYFITIILITINSQHSYKHLESFNCGGVNAFYGMNISCTAKKIRQFEFPGFHTFL